MNIISPSKKVGVLMRARNLIRPLVLLAGLFATGCPTIDMNGVYEYIDFPFSGAPRIDINTDFPSPTFTGTFIVGLFGCYVVPISGIITSANDVAFILDSDDPPAQGLCVCRGYDDGSSIFPGSGQVAGDGRADRIACSTLYGEPVDPALDLWKMDWPQ